MLEASAESVGGFLAWIIPFLEGIVFFFPSVDAVMPAEWFVPKVLHRATPLLATAWHTKA